jgi:hypothetical protein
MSNDLIFITAHCPTEAQELALNKCIDSVLKCGFHVAVISHTHIPLEIQKKCNYYVYDYCNDISDDINLLGNQYFKIADWRIESRLFNKFFYGFAIYRMFSIAGQLAINFGYKNIHHIDYDCELLDKNLILENSKLLETHDSVLYTDDGTERGFMLGAFKSFKVASLPNNFKNYNREFIEETMLKLEPKQLEFLTKNLFIQSGNVLFKPEPPQDKLKKGSVFYNRNLHYTLYYNPVDFTLNIFYESIKNVNEELFIIVNKQTIIKMDINPKMWYTKKLGIFDEIDHIRIDNSKKVIYEKEFDSNFRNVFKTKSYVTANKKNS